MYPRNAATPPRIGIGAVVQISDGAVQTSGVSVAVRPEGGSESAGGGVISYGASGLVYYAPTQAETNYTTFVVVAYKSDCIPVGITVPTSASTTAGRVVLSSETHSGATIPTVSAVTTVNGLASGVITATSIASNAITDAKIASAALTIAKFATDIGTTAYASNPIAQAVCERLLSAMDTSGSLGKKINDIAVPTAESIIETMFTFNATADYAGAAAGSLVKEIADNAGGSTLTVAAIRAEMDANSSKLSAIEADTHEMQSDDIPALIAALENVSQANVQTAASAALVALHLDHLVAVAESDTPVNDSIMAKLASKTGDWSTFVAATDSLEAIRDEGDASWNVSAPDPMRLLSSEINAITSQTIFTLVDGATFDDSYTGQTIVLYDDSNNDYPSVRVITDYVGSTKTVTIDSAPDFTLGADDSADIFATAPGSTAPTTAQIVTAIDGTSSQLAAIVADTNMLQTDLVNGGRLDLIIDEINANAALIVADTNELQTDWVNGGRLDLIIDAILADTNELQSDWTNGGRLDLILDSAGDPVYVIPQAVIDQAIQPAGTTAVHQASQWTITLEGIPDDEYANTDAVFFGVKSRDEADADMPLQIRWDKTADTTTVVRVNGAAPTGTLDEDGAVITHSTYTSGGDTFHRYILVVEGEVTVTVPTTNSLNGEVGLGTNRIISQRNGYSSEWKIVGETDLVIASGFIVVLPTVNKVVE